MEKIEHIMLMTQLAFGAGVFVSLLTLACSLFYWSYHAQRWSSKLRKEKIQAALLLMFWLTLTSWSLTWLFFIAVRYSVIYGIWLQ